MDTGKQVVTMADLEKFRVELLKDLKKLIHVHPVAVIPKPWLKSHEVQKMLKISPGTLQHLRDTGAVKFSKVGGIIFYRVEDIERMIREKEG